MSRFYFHLIHGMRENDDEGVDLPNDEAAQAEAIRTCGQIIRDRDFGLEIGQELRMEVAAETGRRILTLRFVLEP